VEAQQDMASRKLIKCYSGFTALVNLE